MTDIVKGRMIFKKSGFSDGIQKCMRQKIAGKKTIFAGE